MAENIHTGGVMQFRHEGAVGKLDDERKALIEQGYREAEERKQLQRRNNFILWVVVFLIIISIAGYIFLR